MLNTFIALLVEKGVLEDAEGEELAKKISTATLPSDYGSARVQVKKFLAAIAKGK